MIVRVSYVFANYCPHCVPLSLENAEKMATELKVPLHTLNIEISEQEAEADMLVEKCGDWAVDYLIPQVFLEYSDGRVSHIFTGFSESVATTHAAWDALLSSNYFTNLVLNQNNGDGKALKRFVDRYLNVQALCRRPCGKPSGLRELWSNQESIIGAYVCPDGHVSRVVYFSENPNSAWFREFLTSQLDEEIVAQRDIRPATRYGWELEGDALIGLKTISSTASIKEIYWTRYPTEADQNRRIFLCSDHTKGTGCNKLFVQDIQSPKALCPQCKVGETEN
jgi:hypothetical protein